MELPGANGPASKSPKIQCLAECQRRSPASSTYVAPLTGVRALAALLVLGFHTAQNLPSGLPVVLPLVQRGYLGVDLFFLLSGFVITHVYGRFMKVRRHENIKIFLWHRFIRLYPAYFTVLLLLASIILGSKYLDVSLNHPEAWGPNGLIKQLLLIQVFSVTHLAGNIGTGWNAPTWSISAECLAYLLFSLFASSVLAIWSGRIRSIVAAFAALLTLALIFKWADWPLGTIIGVSALLRVVCEFACGAALCCNLRAETPSPKRTGDIMAFAAFLFFVVGASGHWVSDLILAPALALFVWGAANADGAFRRALSVPPIVWLGEISYSIYLVHMPCLWIFRRFWEHLGFLTWPQGARAAAILMTTFLIVVIAAGLFYGVERPTRVRYRDKLGKLTFSQ